MAKRKLHTDEISTTPKEYAMGEIIDMHRAATVVGASRATVEKFLQETGVEPVGATPIKGGALRFYKADDVRRAAKEYDAWHDRNMIERARKANAARYGNRPVTLVKRAANEEQIEQQRAELAVDSFLALLNEMNGRLKAIEALVRKSAG